MAVSAGLAVGDIVGASVKTIGSAGVASGVRRYNIPVTHRLFTILSALSLLLCVSCAHRNEPAVSRGGGPGLGSPTTAPTSVLELWLKWWLGRDEPAARPLGEVLFAAAVYREHHGTWPPSPADPAAFAAHHDLPMDAGAFESLTFEADEEGGRFAIHFALKGERRTEGALLSHGTLRVRLNEATGALRQVLLQSGARGTEE
jgi:hypothetical protein